MANRRVLLFLLLFLALGFPSLAKVYQVRSGKELKGLSLEAGDKVVLLKGKWVNQTLVFRGKGTKEKPITLTVEKPGAVFLTGHSSLKIDGTWLVVDGLVFKEGYSFKEDVIQFSPASEWCRLTNSAVVNFDPPSKTTDYKWISLHGYHNRVDHCLVQGKNHQGTTLVVWLAEKPNYHRIDHNYFLGRPELGGNGGETIRIGTSTWSLHDSFTTVENNVFEACDGEVEIISSKSGRNTIRDNVFYESSGMLTLRHGNGAEVYGNYFIGNGKPKSGGIRVIGENHRVYNNYLHGLTGTGITAALALMNGMPDSPLAGYYQVKNAQLVHNTIVNCEEPISVGVGKNEERTLPPWQCTIANNLVVAKDRLFTWYDQPQHLALSGNVATGLVSKEPAPGGVLIQPLKGKTQKDGLWWPKGANLAVSEVTFPFAQTDIGGTPRANLPEAGAHQTQKQPGSLLKEADIGPRWMKLNLKEKLRIKGSQWGK